MVAGAPPRGGPGDRRPLTVLCVLLALQGAVGLDQYETHLPAELVWVHVGLACLTWLSTLWAACAAGGHAAQRWVGLPRGARRGAPGGPPARVSA